MEFPPKTFFPINETPCTIWQVSFSYTNDLSPYLHSPCRQSCSHVFPLLVVTVGLYLLAYHFLLLFIHIDKYIQKHSLVSYITEISLCFVYHCCYHFQSQTRDNCDNFFLLLICAPLTLLRDNEI